MNPLMNKCFWRLVLVVGTAVMLAGCGNKETKEALKKSDSLGEQKEYPDANNVLVDALRAREDKIRADVGTSTDPGAADALTKKVEADPEILKLERAQIPLYLHMERADLASVIYADMLRGNPGDTAVYDLLRDKDPVIRTGAVRILGLAGHADAIDALIGASKDPNQEVRRAALAALGAIKDPRAVPPLIDGLKDSYWFARSEAANALAQQRDARSVKPLLDAVADPDSTVGTSAQNALLFLCQSPGPVAAPDDLATRLGYPNPKVVLVSAVCLAMLKDPRAVPALLALLHSPDPGTRLSALKGLGETGDPSAIPILRKTLKDPDVNMRGWSIIGLGELKDQGSLDDLRAISADGTQPESIKAAADAAINHIAPPASPPAGPQR